jgi:hypothetical protein
MTHRPDIHYMVWHKESERWECHICGLLEQADYNGVVLRVIRRPNEGHWRSSHVRDLRTIWDEPEPLPKREDREPTSLSETIEGAASVLDELWLGSVGIKW